MVQIMADRDLLAARCLELVHRLLQLGKVIEPLWLPSVRSICS